MKKFPILRVKLSTFLLLCDKNETTEPEYQFVFEQCSRSQSHPCSSTPPSQIVLLRTQSFITDKTASYFKCKKQYKFCTLLLMLRLFKCAICTCTVVVDNCLGKWWTVIINYHGLPTRNRLILHIYHRILPLYKL